MTDTAPKVPLLSRRPDAWKHRGFRQLIRAWLFTNIGDSALFLMVAVWVKDMSGSDGAAAMVFVVMGLPALLAPFIGQIADRMSRKKLLVWTNTAMIPILASLFLVTDVSQLWIIYTVVFFYGVMQYSTASAGSGIIRDLLPDEELASGNGVLQTIDQALRLISPLIGTGLYVAFGPRAVVGLTTVCFVITAILLTRLVVTETPPQVREDGASYWHELSAGFRHLFRTPVLGPLTVVLTVAFGVIGMTNAAIFPVMEQGLGVETAMLGVLVSVQGIGAVIGGVTSSTSVRRFGESGAVALGVGLIGLGLIPFVGTSLFWAIIGMMVIGFGVPWVVVAYSTLRQKVTPANLQGRTAAASNVALSLPQTLVLMGAAAIIDVIDYRILIWVAVGATLACALVAARASTRPTPI